MPVAMLWTLVVSALLAGGRKRRTGVSAGIGKWQKPGVQCVVFPGVSIPMVVDC